MFFSVIIYACFYMKHPDKRSKANKFFDYDKVQVVTESDDDDFKRVNEDVEYTHYNQ